MPLGQHFSVDVFVFVARDATRNAIAAGFHVFFFVFFFSFFMSGNCGQRQRQKNKNWRKKIFTERGNEEQKRWTDNKEESSKYAGRKIASLFWRCLHFSFNFLSKLKRLPDALPTWADARSHIQTRKPPNLMCSRCGVDDTHTQYTPSSQHRSKCIKLRRQCSK